MKQKIFLTAILAMALLMSTGCAKQAVEIGQLANKANQDSEALQVKSRDAKRVADANILSTTIQLYILDTKKIPTIKDGNGNLRAFKLIKNSADFKTLESTIKANDSSMYIPVDPQDPDRYFEFYSDGQIYTIKTLLEQDNGNCKQIKPGYCEFEVKGYAKSVLE